MKDTYDKLFAVIATLGALLAFLGFKGFESFVQAKAKAEQTVEKAEQAIRDASSAKDQAEQAIAEHHKFLTEDYPRNNSSEINVAHGLIMREIAEVYDAVAKHLSKEEASPVEFAERRMRLRDSLNYLERALDNSDTLEIKVVCRALGTVGNVKKMLSDNVGALRAAKGVVKRDPADPSGHYNIACYSSLVGEEEAGRCGAEQEADQVAIYVDDGLVALAQAIRLNDPFRTRAKTDKDLTWLRDHPMYSSRFFEVLRGVTDIHAAEAFVPGL
jgi:ElaB/YqjD/DUF883 family membrane-anchored ribosome-binding protein